jgi:hypothetical protein
MTIENRGSKSEVDPVLDMTGDGASDLTEPLKRTPTTASQTTSAATEPTHAHPAVLPMLSKTDPKLDVPASTAGRSPTPEYHVPANAQRADNDVPVYRPGGKFNNEVEGEE